MRYQDPETAVPREPTLAEQRARERAEQRRAEEEAKALAEAERKSDARRRLMVGGGVTVGVVALVAAFYSGSVYSQQKNAQRADCTATHPETGQTIAQPEEYCDPAYRQEHGVHDPHTGMFLMPLFLPGGGPGPLVGPGQYRYSYSPAGSPAPSPGQRVSNPNFTKPSGSEIKTKSGTTIQRGGFGLNSKVGGSGS